jgi:hypothetical protein
MFFSFYLLSWSLPFMFALILVARYRKLRSIPGPKLAALTDFWRAYNQNFGSFTSKLTRLHDEYGSLVRVGPNTVSASNAAAVSTIYSMHGEFRKVLFITHVMGNFGLSFS